MSGSVQILHLAVIGPLVRHVESGRNGAAVGIEVACFEEILVQILVEIIDRIVKGQQDHLWDVLDLQTT